ncbi:Male sterility protein [Nesidiocoris tenuis]|uniref:Fatty acyl-CoA reductase n=1 Tax=Nesidiocoris tenuis TaxID=355587 RepID=A0ABN7BAU5_9HEMI|nr:Male sterility protein [Nesidiocoris tenuis]
MPPSMAEWLTGKDILITGGTGFMGKLLVEKILRCCPGVNRLYMVVRTKGGGDANARIDEYKKNVIFSVLLEKDPNIFEKLVVIPGDMTELCCGISEEHQKLLQENVSIVFHTAASVRFDDSVTKALKLNTRGTHELIKIAKGMKKLEVFEHVSTTYCHIHDQDVIGEEVYPTHLDWRELIELVDRDEEAMNALVYKLLWTQPNTYTFSKALAENIVAEAAKELPVVIVRPSVVTTTYREPLVGWTDNLNGVIGVSVATAKGVLRTFRCQPDYALGYVPGDVAINGMFVGAWSRRFFDDGKLQVFNETYHDTIAVTFNHIMEIGLGHNANHPTENYMWYPFLIMTCNTYYYHFLFFFLQLLPALIFDTLLTIAGKRRMILRLNIKIYNAAMALAYFTVRPVRFINEKYRKIHWLLSPDDQFSFAACEEGFDINVSEFILDAHFGTKKYIFKEKKEDMDRYRTVHKRLYYLHVATKVVMWSVGIWLTTKWTLLSYLNLV